MVKPSLYSDRTLCFFLEFYDESWCLRAPMDMWSHRRMAEWISSFKIFLHFIPSFQHMAGRTGLLYRIHSASSRRYMAWLRRMTMDMELCIYPTDCVSIMYILIQQMQVISFMEHSWIRRVTRQMQISISTAFDEWWESMSVMEIQNCHGVGLGEMGGVGVQFLFGLTRRFSGISLGKVQPRFLSSAHPNQGIWTSEITSYWHAFTDPPK